MKENLWISHSAINSFESCPKSYYYKYHYRNPETGNRLQVVNPYFSLGLAVHKTIEELGGMSVEERLEISLKDRFERIWSNFSGREGGFLSDKQEREFKQRGEKMIERVLKSGFLEKPSIEIDEKVPNIDLDPEKNIKLVGSLDWIQKKKNGGYHIIDFKTGKSKESSGSLQLPIYNVLAEEKLEGEVERVSYWYLESDDEPTSKELETKERSLKRIKEKALKIYDYVRDDNYPCNYNGNCFACNDFKRIFAGKAEYLGEDPETGKDRFFVLKEEGIIKKLLDKEIFTSKEKEIFKARMNGKDLEEISEKINLPVKRLEKISTEIKKKMIDNLKQKEVKILVNEKLK